MALRSEPLEFTLLGLLATGPLHGYELRKRSLTIMAPSELSPLVRFIRCSSGWLMAG